MNAVILAAGKGTRLGPIGSLTSKPALPLLGVPMITRVLRSIAHCVEKIIVVVNPEDSHIKDVLSSTPWTSHEVQIIAQKEPLGSGDALRAAWPFVDGDCLVTACDSLMKRDFIGRFVKHYRNEGPDALVGVMSFEDHSPLPGSVVALGENGQIQKFIEKPTAAQLISDKMALPIYAFKPSFGAHLAELELSERSEYEIPQAIQNLIHQGGVVSSYLAEQRVTINSPREYLETVLHLLSDQGEAQIEPGVGIAPTATIHAPVYAESGARVDSGATVGPGVYLMAGSVVRANATVADSIVFKQAEVSEHIMVRGKIVMPASIIDPQKFRDSHGRARHR